MKKQQIYRYTGNPAQLFGLRRVQLQEGRAAGVNVIEAHTAGDLQVDILPDTGLDLGLVRFKGKNVSFQSKNGYDSLAANAHNTEFLQTFPGGLLYTCGLRSVGPANHDGGEWHPLHGRIHGLQAQEVCAYVDDDRLVVSGVLRETALFGHALQLRRTITLPVWDSRVIIEDCLENLTPKAEELMLLYHFNFGYPMLSEDARLILPEQKKTTPRSEFAQTGIDRLLEFDPPVDGEEERVFFHEDMEPWARLENPSLGISAALRWSGDTLPILAQWRSMASGDYVLGLEPTNSYIMGRSAERKNGTLQSLGAFESVQTRTELSFEHMEATL